MTKNLKVIKPFAMMEVGDIFELSENGTYVSSYNENYDSASVDSANITACFTGSYEISSEYAEQLIENGYLVDLTNDTKNNVPFVNVFDEIDHLRKLYTDDLDALAKEAEEMPACLKVEKETVLRNMIKVLDYLNSLKK